MGKHSTAISLGLILGALLVTPARAEIHVEFVDPQGYTDAGGYGIDDHDQLAVLEQHFLRLGAACIKGEDRLDLRILNVDLAGRKEWWRPGGYDLRIMQDVTWPRIDLEFVWRDGQGALLDRGPERLVDLDYLGHVAARTDPDRLPYEKAMIRDWFERRFCRPPHGSST